MHLEVLQQMKNTSSCGLSQTNQLGALFLCSDSLSEHLDLDTDFSHLSYLLGVFHNNSVTIKQLKSQQMQTKLQTRNKNKKPTGVR